MVAHCDFKHDIAALGGSIAFPTYLKWNQSNMRLWIWWIPFRMSVCPALWEKYFSAIIICVRIYRFVYTFINLNTLANPNRRLGYTFSKSDYAHRDWDTVTHLPTHICKYLLQLVTKKWPHTHGSSSICAHVITPNPDPLIYNADVQCMLDVTFYCWNYVLVKTLIFEILQWWVTGQV